MTKVVNVHEAKTNLSRLLVEVENGHEVTIARAGRPVARLVPAAHRRSESSASSAVRSGSRRTSTRRCPTSGSTSGNGESPGRHPRLAVDVGRAGTPPQRGPHDPRGSGDGASCLGGQCLGDRDEVRGGPASAADIRRGMAGGSTGTGGSRSSCRSASRMRSGPRTLPPHHRDPFDRMLVAQAQTEGLVLVSADRQLEPYEVERLPA